MKTGKSETCTVFGKEFHFLVAATLLLCTTATLFQPKIQRWVVSSVDLSVHARGSQVGCWDDVTGFVKFFNEKVSYLLSQKSDSK